MLRTIKNKKFEERNRRVVIMKFNKVYYVDYDIIAKKPKEIFRSINHSGRCFTSLEDANLCFNRMCTIKNV